MGVDRHYISFAHVIDGMYNGKTILLLGKKNRVKLEQMQLSAAGTLVLEILLDVSFYLCMCSEIVGYGAAFRTQIPCPLQKGTVSFIPN